MKRTAFAPGKLFLFGEYSVIATGWAIVAAVELGTTVSFDSSRTQYRVLAGDQVYDDFHHSKLPRLVLRAAESDLPIEGFESDLSATIYNNTEKLGVGSSAASCAGVAAIALPDGTPAERFAAASYAHRRFQYGRGSHADVAASCYGGVIAYRLLEAVHPFPCYHPTPRTAPEYATEEVSIAQINRLQLPEELEVFGYWLGSPANSRSQLCFVEQMLYRHETQEALKEINHATEEALKGFDNNDAAQVIDAAKLGRLAMHDLERASGVPIWTEEATRLEHLLYEYPVEVKISGAGGGDFALVFGQRGSIDWDEVRGRIEGYWLKIHGEVEGAHLLPS